MKRFSLMMGVACLLLSPVVHAEATSSDAETHVKTTDDGNYTATTKAQETDSAGTAKSKEQNVKMSTDSNGASDKTVTTTKSTDPKGLMNKTTEKSTDETKTTANGAVKHTHKHTVNGKTVDQSDQSMN